MVQEKQLFKFPLSTFKSVYEKKSMYQSCTLLLTILMRDIFSFLISWGFGSWAILRRLPPVEIIIIYHPTLSEDGRNIITSKNLKKTKYATCSWELSLARYNSKIYDNMRSIKRDITFDTEKLKKKRNWKIAIIENKWKQSKVDKLLYMENYVSTKNYATRAFDLWTYSCTDLCF